MLQLFTERSVKFGYSAALIGRNVNIEVAGGIQMGALIELRVDPVSIQGGMSIGCARRGFCRRGFYRRRCSGSIRALLPTNAHCSQARASNSHCSYVLAIEPKFHNTLLA